MRGQTLTEADHAEMARVLLSLPAPFTYQQAAAAYGISEGPMVQRVATMGRRHGAMLRLVDRVMVPSTLGNRRRWVGRYELTERGAAVARSLVANFKPQPLALAGHKPEPEACLSRFETAWRKERSTMQLPEPFDDGGSTVQVAVRRSRQWRAGV